VVGRFAGAFSGTLQGATQSHSRRSGTMTQTVGRLKRLDHN